MASIRENGAVRQSGSGFHARKGEPGRKRTRAAVVDAEINEQLGQAFRYGQSFTNEFDVNDPYDKYAEWDN